MYKSGGKIFHSGTKFLPARPPFCRLKPRSRSRRCLLPPSPARGYKIFFSASTYRELRFIALFGQASPVFQGGPGPLKRAIPACGPSPAGLYSHRLPSSCPGPPCCPSVISHAFTRGNFLAPPPARKRGPPPFGERKPRVHLVVPCSTA